MNSFSCITKSYISCFKSIFEIMTMRTKPKYHNLDEDDVESLYLNESTIHR